MSISDPGDVSLLKSNLTGKTVDRSSLKAVKIFSMFGPVGIISSKLKTPSCQSLPKRDTGYVSKW